MASPDEAKAYGLNARSAGDLREAHVRACGNNAPSGTKPEVVKSILRCLNGRALLVTSCKAPRIDKGAYTRLLNILENLDWTRYQVKGQTSGRALEKGQGSILLGTSHGVPLSHGFDANGHNHDILPGKASRKDAVALRTLWDELKALTKRADRAYVFSSVQVNRNFTGHPHRDKSDKTYQFALSLGQFKGGYLVVATDDPLHLTKYNTNGRLTKCDGRHTHWVTPHTGGDRYSLIMYNITADETPRLSNFPKKAMKCTTGRFDSSSEPRRKHVG